MRADITIVVVLDDEMVRDIKRSCAASPGVETGGLLFVVDGKGMATGPGARAVCGPQTLEWDASFIAGCLSMAAALGVELMGRWHKHTSPVILASAEDRESAERFRQFVGMEQLVDVIVACDDQDRPIGWAAYVCDEDGYERVNLELSVRSSDAYVRDHLPSL